MKLFAVYIGGKTKSSLIEVHDMRFMIGNTIEDTYEDLRASWWGTPKSLHMDCFGELVSADGYNVVLKTEPSSAVEKLYFVNLGGYHPEEFTEQHKNVFVVAETEALAKDRALQQTQGWALPHKDAMYEVEEIFCLDVFARQKGFYIHLEKTDAPRPFKFKCGFFKLY